ncbi:hypothetical protein JYU34_005993 [Plutella xylostella]|uniref:Uncharacterized protein n=1 Tax=Plutella xylostella TaxID=51655 RepID=A0ABQ7QUN0_PLUXY|nr:hypothetical protein JYU34_005993 [Plutella xylostella]
MAKDTRGNITCLRRDVDAASRFSGRPSGPSPQASPNSRPPTIALLNARSRDSKAYLENSYLQRLHTYLPAEPFYEELKLPPPDNASPA